MTMLPPPARFQGTAQQQLAQCYSYLFQLHQQLNNALAALPAALPAGSGRAFSQAGSAGEEIDQGIHREAEALRALIVQNASYIRREMDKLRTELAGSYVAVSDFGQYLQELNAAIEADPAAVTQYYSFLSVLQADLSAWRPASKPTGWRPRGISAPASWAMKARCPCTGWRWARA